MDIYKLKFTCLQNSIMRFLCINAERKMNQRKIAKSLDVSATAIAKALPLLQKEGLINIEKGDSMNSIGLNLDNDKVLRFKRMENLKIIYESYLVDFLEDKFPGSTIILFGSYSKGEDIYDSDIDIAIIEHSKRKVDLKKYEAILEREIRINFYSSLSNLDKGLKENLCNGFVLSGGIEL